ncbi:MAG TPA: DNRLRE domain-containing protein, partial [Acidobacteriaceae bacterium]|nr:DNRLRE domain-containing protein [Acidobacteriaceae bacterium]
MHSPVPACSSVRVDARPPFWSLVILVLLLSISGVARATQATLTGDTFVSTTRPSSNFGALSNLYVGNGNTALLQFDLTQLPVGTTSAQIARATLTIYVNRVYASGALTVQPVTSTWTEMGATAATIPGFGTPTVTIPAISQGYTFYTVDVTSLMAGLLSSNNGLALTSSSASVVLDSKENDATGHPAQLDITLTGPQGPAGIQGPVANFQGAWSGSTAYTAGQAVFYNGSSYITPAGSTGTTPGTNPSDWVVLAQSGTSFTYQGTWLQTTTYNVNDVVTASDGSSYISLQSGNLGKTPVGNSNPSYWAVLAQVGAVGPIGPTPAISVGSTSTGAAGSSASVAISGSSSAPILSFTIPQGMPGNTGPQGAQGLQGNPVSFKGNFVSGTPYVVGDAVFCSTTCSTNGSSYIAMKANTSVDPSTDVLNAGGNWSLLASQGAIGLTGATPAISVGSTTTGAAGTSASVAISGTSSAPVLSFTIPQGIQGNTGSTGNTGLQGPPVSFIGPYNAGTTYGKGDAVSYTDGSSYISRQASNTGNPPSSSPTFWAVLAQAGSAATVSVGSVSTGAAAVTNVGTTSAAILNFTVPQGVQGPPGNTGIQGPQGIQGPAGANGSGINSFDTHVEFENQANTLYVSPSFYGTTLPQSYGAFGSFADYPVSCTMKALNVAVSNVAS